MSKCYGCDAQLIPVFRNQLCSHTGCTLEHHVTQLDDALHVIFIGGYGMFFDGYSPQMDAMFCKNCAQKIVDLFPKLDADFNKPPPTY